MPRSKASVSLSQIRVGIFVLFAIVVLIFLILNASGDINPFSRKLHIKARFADANGLRDGSEVRLAGADLVREIFRPLFAEGLGHADELVARLALAFEGGDEGSLLELGLLVAPDLPVGFAGLVFREVFALLELDDETAERAELVFLEH